MAPVAAPPVVPLVPVAPVVPIAPPAAPVVVPEASPTPSISHSPPPDAGPAVRHSGRERRAPGEWWKVQHREPTPMIESSDDEEADEQDSANEDANEDVPGAFSADLEVPEFAFAASLGPESNSYRQALMHPDADHWTKAAEEEIDAHSRNGTW